MYKWEKLGVINSWPMLPSYSFFGKRLLLLSVFLLYISLCLGIGPAQAAENILPATVVEGRIQQDTNLQIGDVDIPVCDNKTLNHNAGGFRDYSWIVKSDIGSGSSVYIGREWKVTFEILKHSSTAGLLGNGDDGIDPLRLLLVPTGPVTASVAPSGEIFNLAVFGGDDPVALINSWGSWGFVFDNNSKPGAFEVSDGVAARLTITMKATAPGVITLPQAEVEGYDATPIAGAINCDPMPVNMSWNVIEKQGIDFPGFNFLTDARYSKVHPMDANLGPHAVAIDVLDEADDLDYPGGPGDTNEIRILAWNETTDEGGTFVCGAPEQNNPPEDTPFGDLATGPCIYTPPLNHSGGDRFIVAVKGLSGSLAQTTVITAANIVANTPPQIADPGFGTNPGVDEVFDMTPSLNDPDGDAIVCSANGDPTPAGVGTATIFSDCSIDWDNTNLGFTGNVKVPITVCDTHATLTNLGSQGSRTPNYADGDISSLYSRRCTDGEATIAIHPAMVIPPTGVSDKDIVDAGYAADGVGAYTLRIPVLDNDFDGNGPDPSLPSANLGVLTPPDVSEGTASFDGDELVFTPADGFNGTVTMTYRVCEDPALQSPPYFDNPNTPGNEGLPFCGVGAVSIQVIANNAPAVVDDAKTIADNVILSGFDLGANDFDADGDPISCTAGTPVASNPGLVSNANVSADCKLSFDPVDGQAGVVEFTYEVCDQHTLSTPAYPAIPYGDPDGLAPGEISSRCSTGLAVITVALAQNPEPDPLDLDPEPSCVADDATTGIGIPVIIQVLANDTDFDDQLQPSPVILTGPPADEPEIGSAGGSANMNGANTIIYTPPANFEGVDTFSYTVRDEVGQGCKAEVTVTVSADAASDAIAVPLFSNWARFTFILLVLIGSWPLLRKL